MDGPGWGANKVSFPSNSQSTSGPTDFPHIPGHVERRAADVRQSDKQKTPSEYSNNTCGVCIPIETPSPLGSFATWPRRSRTCSPAPAAAAGGRTRGRPRTPSSLSSPSGPSPAAPAARSATVLVSAGANGCTERRGNASGGGRQELAEVQERAKKLGC